MDGIAVGMDEGLVVGAELGENVGAVEGVSVGCSVVGALVTIGMLMSSSPFRMNF